MEENYVIKNIKASIKVPPISFEDITYNCWQKNLRLKRCQNFVMIYFASSLRISIFKRSLKHPFVQHCNITGVNSILTLDEAINTLCEIVNCSVVDIKEKTIDNISAGGKVPTPYPINLESCIPFIENEGLWWKFNKEVSSGLCIQGKPFNQRIASTLKHSYKNNKEFQGTALIYASGSFLLVGCKKEKDCKVLTEKIYAIFKSSIDEHEH